MFFRTSWIVILIHVICLTSARQFCGSDLADVMALVCSGRGYNVAFKTNIAHSERRFKRGIVDECCKRGCSWSTLETYCSPGPSDLQIRKRSDISSKYQPESTEADVTRINKFMYDINKLKNSKETDNQRNWELNVLVEKPVPSYPNKYFSSWNGLSRVAHGHSGPAVVNKVKRNNIEERKESQIDKYNNGIANSNRWQPFFNEAVSPGREKLDGQKKMKSSSISHRHRKSDLSRKVMEESAINTSQIGTVPPYFHGRTLVLPPSRN